MTPKIDEPKLRKYFSDAKAAHAALMSAWEDIRAARRELGDAELTLTRAKAAAPNVAHGQRAKSADPARDEMAAAEQKVKAAKAKLARLEAERERLDDVWQHTSRLKNSVAEFASTHGALPADLAEDFR